MNATETSPFYAPTEVSSLHALKSLICVDGVDIGERIHALFTYVDDSSECYDSYVSVLSPDDFTTTQRKIRYVWRP